MLIVRSISGLQREMQFARLFRWRLIAKACKVEARSNLDVLLREVVAGDQHFANLVNGIGILAL